MTLGAFLAGVLLADSEYRHDIEASIEPFKGLLLGLFFIAVGMSANLGLLASHPFAVIGAALGLMAVKAAVLVGLGAATGHGAASTRSLAVLPAHAGEFAFVLFGVAASSGLRDAGCGPERRSHHDRDTLDGAHPGLLPGERERPESMARARRAAEVRCDRRRGHAHHRRGHRPRGPDRHPGAEREEDTAMSRSSNYCAPRRPSRRASSCSPSTTSRPRPALPRWCASTSPISRSTPAPATASMPWNCGRLR